MKIRDVEDGAEGEAEKGSFFDEEEELEWKLVDVPFEELQKACADGSGTSFIRKNMLENNSGRANKNIPAKLSSNVPIRRFREVIQAPKKIGDNLMDKVSAFGERLPPKLTHFQGHSHTMKIKDVEEKVEDGTKGEAEKGSFFDEEEELERKLADVPFEELQKAFADGSGTSFIRKHMLEHKSGRANKNRPAELSSKVPIRRFREVIQAPKKVFRDPRFESLSGNFDQEGFRKRYNFLYEVELPAEKEKLKKMLEKTKDQNLAAELQNRISWTDKQMRSGLSSSKKSDSKILAEHKKKEREATKQGKRPFYLKKSEIRERRLIEKYDELKATGKLESFLEKKRRRNASKDHRYIPYRRPTNLSQN